MRLSIIIPALNEAARLPGLLDHLAKVCSDAELIVVDGGSDDGSRQLVSRAGVRLMSSGRGRARQMNAGAVAASGEMLLFLHADTLLPAFAGQAIEAGILRNRIPPEKAWGRFDVCIDSRSFMLRVVAYLMNWRSRLTGIATGDQAIFVARRLFEAAGGFPEQPLMEDIELSRRLRALSKPVCLREQATTSGRRWEERGMWKTIWLMWRLRWSYWRGVPASELARLYQ